MPPVWEIAPNSAYQGGTSVLFPHIHFWPGLGLPRPKAIVVIPKNQPLPKHLREKTSKSAKPACHYATKKDPLK